MKRSVLMAVAVMVGSMAMMTGCKSSSDEASQKDEGAQETTTPAQTPSQDSAAQSPAKSDESATIKASVGVGTGTPAPRYAPSAPPAPRYEPTRPPPSPRHVWVKGHWRWSGCEWTWIGGRFEIRRDGRIYVEPRYEREHDRYRYVPGHWVRR